MLVKICDELWKLGDHMVTFSIILGDTRGDIELHHHRLGIGKQL